MKSILADAGAVLLAAFGGLAGAAPPQHPGEEKLTFHGSSYETLLGEMYAERFPHRVRAMDHSVGTRGFLEPLVFVH